MICSENARARLRSRQRAITEAADVLQYFCACQETSSLIRNVLPSPSNPVISSTDPDVSEERKQGLTTAGGATLTTGVA